MKHLGFNVSRSGLYLRLLPRRNSSTEGLKHVKTVPVQLLRSQNTARRFHTDTHFAAATVKYLKDLAVLFGKDSVCVISQDDKARIPLGLPAANKQGPILMKLDYKVKLPDHDYVVASKHKLISSVYAGLDILDDRVTYSGPTYIAVRSGKHDSSTAAGHVEDIDRLLGLEEFKPLTVGRPMLNESSLNSEHEPSTEDQSRRVKPILIILVDGGPDESPRYPKTMKYAAITFTRQNLDALFIVTHAPGQSASNPVERRMAPLSRDLCGLILPHESYGSHLSPSGKTIDLELEKRNFQKAGELLAEVWSERTIDGHPVVCEYVQPGTNVRIRKPQLVSIEDEVTDSAFNSGTDPSNTNVGNFAVDKESFEFLTETWKSQHVKQSQYLLQIVKCGSISCCGPVRTNLREFLRDQFIPAPIPLTRSEGGIKISFDPKIKSKFFDLTTRLSAEFLLENPITCFDSFCPSVQSTLKERTCAACGEYFVTKVALNNHKKIHKKKVSVFEESDNDEDEGLELFTVEPEILEADGIELIDDLGNWLSSPFCNVEDVSPADRDSMED